MPDQERYFIISEKVPINKDKIVFSVQAQDGDVSVNAIDYSLVDPRGSFSINPTTSEVKIAKLIDRDVEDFVSYFDLSITATCLVADPNDAVRSSYLKSLNKWIKQAVRDRLLSIKLMGPTPKRAAALGISSSSSSSRNWFSDKF
ncbi:uncharacterized protein LOC124312653 [Daphnia pulicaria]|uniref:uncharacterized protein LOC124312653 n=1 Tax=Daphnia pulicaria TaxID=35523 RepID=UPI001EEB07DA|nr:uncharacterized protein LOC124312653 [Daphnia pulicaria]